MIKRILFLKQIPLCPDFGQLALRVILYLPLFLKHGTEKLFTFGQMTQHFPDPLGIGVVPSLLFAALADGICTLLLILGLFTRWASFILFVNVFVAWALVHHFALLGKGNDHGELIVLYLWAFAALMVTGSGRYSVEALLKDKPKA